jgi:uncharacterized protein (DUF1810 family)
MESVNVPFTLQRFVDTQVRVYRTVVYELHAGRKRSHLISFIFPQIAGLGSSPMAARRASIKTLARQCSASRRRSQCLGGADRLRHTGDDGRGFQRLEDGISADTSLAQSVLVSGHAV